MGSDGLSVHVIMAEECKISDVFLRKAAQVFQFAQVITRIDDSRYYCNSVQRHHCRHAGISVVHLASAAKRIHVLSFSFISEDAIVSLGATVSDSLSYRAMRTSQTFGINM